MKRKNLFFLFYAKHIEENCKEKEVSHVCRLASTEFIKPKKKID